MSKTTLIESIKADLGYLKLVRTEEVFAQLAEEARVSGAEQVDAFGLDASPALSVIAGALGTANARIFCRKFEAELVSIDGFYKTADQMDPALRGQPVEHPKYGTGTIVRREGEGDDAKVTVIFQRYGMKKLVEKYAGLK